MVIRHIVLHVRIITRLIDYTIDIFDLLEIKVNKLGSLSITG